MKYMFKKFCQLFKKNQINKLSDRPLDIFISLTDTYEIDLSIFMQPNLDNLPPEEISSLAEKYAEFFHILTSAKLKSQIIEILVDQIKTESNAHFIENIIVFWSIIDNEYKKQLANKHGSVFIKPSQVFSTHKNPH